MKRQIDQGLQHASCVDFEGKGVLILGASGSGKSSLAIACMSLGATLVGDDYVDIQLESDQIVAKRPPNISGLIEVPKIGILKCTHLEKTKIALAVDMSKNETARLPRRRHIVLQNCEIPLIYGGKVPYLHSVVHQFLKGGFADV